MCSAWLLLQFHPSVSDTTQTHSGPITVQLKVCCSSSQLHFLLSDEKLTETAAPLSSLSVRGLRRLLGEQEVQVASSFRSANVWLLLARNKTECD